MNRAKREDLERISRNRKLLRIMKKLKELGISDDKIRELIQAKENR